MPFQESLPSEADIVIVYRRSHQQRGVDVFRGDTDERLADEYYGDVRETKGIKLYDLIRSGNRLAGDPLGVAEYLRPVGPYGPEGGMLSDTGPLPDPAQFFVLGIHDP